ncbi:MAG: hypothetical protein WCO13_13245 [Bacteroidota bacterium]
MYFQNINAKKENNNVYEQKNVQSPISSTIKYEVDDEIFIDENGDKYQNVTKTIEIPRKTFILGKLTGKYWGELDFEKERFKLNSKFYNFKLYEAEIQITDRNEHPKGPFKFIADASFSKDKLPEILCCKISDNSITGEYEIILHEPKVKDVKIDRKHHQIEGNETFGIITAEITGYILDSFTETYIEKIPVIDYPIEGSTINDNQPKYTINTLTKTNITTGNIEYKDNYIRHEYYYSDFKQKYWGGWTFNRSPKNYNQEGCLSSFFWIIFIIIGISFLLLLLPNLMFILPFLLLPLLFRLFSSSIWFWILRIIGGALLLLFLISIIFAISNVKRNTYIPTPVVQDVPEEVIPKVEPITDTLGNSTNDSLIVHYRKWKDYEGNEYAGKFWVKTSDYHNSRSYKNNLYIANDDNISGYDKMLFSIKEKDKNSLDGLYQLFDSIKKSNTLSNSKFAEMIVSFVQDIPYSVILPYGCDASLYSDNFIREYLSSPNARCDGNERFGINTPVEFLASLNGDCDTRTLLLYTIFQHYSYDVALLSSEQYSHSMLGINTFYKGKAYYYQNQRYVFWETTSPNIKPGVLPTELSNTNYWRISLKSK